MNPTFDYKVRRAIPQTTPPSDTNQSLGIPKTTVPSATNRRVWRFPGPPRVNQLEGSTELTESCYLMFGGLGFFWGFLVCFVLFVFTVKGHGLKSEMKQLKQSPGGFPYIFQLSCSGGAKSSPSSSSKDV